MTQHKVTICRLVVLLIGLLFPGSSMGFSDDPAEDLGQISWLTARPLARARGEVQIKRLRQLIATKKIDADNLLKALQALRENQ